MVISQKKEGREIGTEGREKGHAWGTGRLQREVGESCFPCSSLRGLFKQGGVAGLLDGLGPERARHPQSLLPLTQEKEGGGSDRAQVFLRPGENGQQRFLGGKRGGLGVGRRGFKGEIR